MVRLRCPYVATCERADRLHRFGRNIASLPVFMLIVTLGMYILFTAYWAIDVYLLWIEVYRYLPQQQTESGVVMFLDGLLIPWSAAYYVQTAFQFMMVIFTLERIGRSI